MSVAFAQRGRPPAAPTQLQIQSILNENSQLLQTIQDYQNKGKAAECMQYQQTLHRNLVYLASVADASQNISVLLPPPQAPPGGLVNSAPHGPLNSPAVSTQPQGPPPVSEVQNAQSPGPPPVNYYPQQPHNNYRPPQPQQPIVTHRPVTSSPNTQQPNRPAGMPNYPQYLGFHPPPGAGSSYPTHSPSNMPNPSYQQPSGNYAPPGPAPYPQQPPAGYGPPVSSAPGGNPNYGIPSQTQPIYGNAPGYPPGSQQPNYGLSYGQPIGYGPGVQPIPPSGPGQAMPYPSNYPASYGGQQSGYPASSVQNGTAPQPPPPVQSGFNQMGAGGYQTPITSNSYSQAIPSPSTATQTYVSNNAPQNYPPVSQSSPNAAPVTNNYPQGAPGAPQGPTQPGSYVPPPQVSQQYPQTANQGYPVQNYPQQGYPPQPYSSPSALPYQQYQRPPGPQAPIPQPAQYANYNYQPPPPQQ